MDIFARSDLRNSQKLNHRENNHVYSIFEHFKYPESWHSPNLNFERTFISGNENSTTGNQDGQELLTFVASFFLACMLQRNYIQNHFRDYNSCKATKLLFFSKKNSLDTYTKTCWQCTFGNYSLLWFAAELIFLLNHFVQCYCCASLEKNSWIL